PAYAAKFSPNIRASFAACRSYSAGSTQVLFGLRTADGTSGQVVGTSTLKTGSRSYGILSSAPDNAARIIARVYAVFIRFPVPYGPPVQPVFTSQTRAWWRAIFSPNIRA